MLTAGGVEAGGSRCHAGRNVARAQPLAGHKVVSSKRRR